MLKMNFLRSKELYGNNSIFIKSIKNGGTEKTSSVFLMWRITINFLYYFGVAPFKCEINAENGQCYLKTSWLHKIRSLLQAWIPFFMNEFNYAWGELQTHFAIEKPNAKAYLNLFYFLLVKFNYVLVFITFFCRRNSLTTMLNHILNTCDSLKRYSIKKEKNVTKNIPYFVVGILFLARFAINITWIVKEFTPDHEASESFSVRFYRVFVETFRRRFCMDISVTYTFTVLDYFLGICEVYFRNLSRLMWVSFDMLISCVIPLTFTIAINKFDEVLRNLASEDEKPAFSACFLFDNLIFMSEHVNSNWGTICLIWAFYNSTRVAFRFIVSSSTSDTMNFVDSTPAFICLCLLLYFSGEVFIKIAKFMVWLADQRNWRLFKSETEKDELQRIFVQLDKCCLGIGKTGLYRLNYSFSAQMLVLGITLFVIVVDT